MRKTLPKEGNSYKGKFLTDTLERENNYNARTYHHIAGDTSNINLKKKDKRY